MGIEEARELLDRAGERLRQSFEGRCVRRGAGAGAGAAPAAIDAAGFRAFLAGLLPPHLRVAAGEVVDARGRLSGPVDCAVLGPAHPFVVERDGADGVLLAEGVLAVIHLVSDLADAAAREGAFDDVARVKELRTTSARGVGSVLIARGATGPSPRRATVPVAVLALDGPPLDDLVAAVRADADARAATVAEQVDLVAVLGRGLVYNRKEEADPVDPGREDELGPAKVDAGARTLAVFLGLLDAIFPPDPPAGPLFPPYGRALGLELERSEEAPAPAAPVAPGAPAVAGHGHGHGHGPGGFAASIVQQALRVAGASGPMGALPFAAPASPADMQAMVASAMRMAQEEADRARREAARYEAAARAEAERGPEPSRLSPPGELEVARLEAQRERDAPRQEESEEGFIS